EDQGRHRPTSINARRTGYLSLRCANAGPGDFQLFTRSLGFLGHLVVPQRCENEALQIPDMPDFCDLQ
ncbi:unnamed protein product, partial [Laminaria digitata]